MRASTFLIALSMSVPAMAAGPAEAETVKGVAVVLFDPGCADPASGDEIAGAAAGAVPPESIFRVQPAGKVKTGQEAGLEQLAAGIEEAKKQYFSLSYKKAAGTLEAVSRALPSIPLDESGEHARWAAYENAMAYLALSRLAGGDRAGYLAVIKELAETRPGAVFDGRMPPGLRRDFAGAAGGGAGKTELSIQSPTGGWRVMIDGMPAGKTPVRAAVFPGRRMVGVAGPGNLISYAAVDVPETGATFRFEPFGSPAFAHKAGDGIVLCMPSGALFTPGDAASAGKALGAPAVLAILRSGDSAELKLVDAATGAVRAASSAALGGADRLGGVKGKVGSLFRQGPERPPLPELASATPAAAAGKKVEAGNPAPWYKSWWFWTVVGGAAAAAAGATTYFCIAGSNGSTLGGVPLNR